MQFQVFTRRAGSGLRPRRRQIVDTIEEARAICKAGNDARTARQMRERFFWEFANLPYFNEAWP